MAELLAHKNMMRAGHRASATKMIGQVYEALVETEINLSRLKQQKTVIEEKMNLLRRLHEEILDSLTEEEEIVEEIEQAVPIVASFS